MLGNGMDVLGLAIGANEIEGTGFTASIGGRKPIFNGCGWSFFWNFRGSFLWSDTSAFALTEADALATPAIGIGSAHSRDLAAATERHANVFIAEVLAGIEYERCLQCYPATVFFRAAFEFQHWETGDPRAQSNSFAFLQGAPPAFGGRADAFSVAHDGNLDLIGFRIGCGFRY